MAESGDIAGKYRVAVVGATGQVGTLMRQLLHERHFPAREIVPFASARSAGTQLPEGLVQPLTPETIQGFDLAIFSAGAVASGEWAPQFAATGAYVIDNSSRWRGDDEVPLVVPEINPETIYPYHRIIANPNCSTIQMVVALKPLYDAAGIERLVISTYQCVSGIGSRGTEELMEQSASLIAGGSPREPASFPRRIAFNVIPHAGDFLPDGGPGGVDDHTTEERKMMNETRKILGDTDIGIAVTCVRVPVVTGHSETVNIQTRKPLSAETARKLLRSAPGVTVWDDPAEGDYPTPVDVVGRDDVLVGRIRDDESHPNALSLWVVGDNLRKGAATNALQIAEFLDGCGLLGSG
jgi:aspartate-semialdehyde dehydrogenase